MTDLEEAVQLDPQVLADLVAWPEFRRWQTERRDAEMRAARPSQQDLQRRYRAELKQREAEGPAVEFHGWTLRPDGSRQYDRSVSPEGPFPPPVAEHDFNGRDRHRLTLQVVAAYWQARVEAAEAAIDTLKVRNNRVVRPLALEEAEMAGIRQEIDEVLQPKHDAALAELQEAYPGTKVWPFVS